jgi:hypothetical protein
MSLQLSSRLLSLLKDGASKRQLDQILLEFKVHRFITSGNFSVRKNVISMYSIRYKA